jgi:hypothetical protein
MSLYIVVSGFCTGGCEQPFKYEES